MSTLASVILRDVIANRPSASIPGRLFYATDTQAEYRDNGTSWDVFGASGVTYSFSPNETPSGAINGTNVTFTVASAPSPSSTLALYRNGLRLTLGTHFTLSSNTITMAVAPTSGDNLTCDYQFAGPSSFPGNEVPSGLINGTNTAFTLASSPAPPSSLKLFQNGLRLILSTHFTLSGNAITMAVAPAPGDNLVADYEI